MSAMGAITRTLLELIVGIVCFVLYRAAGYSIGRHVEWEVRDNAISVIQ